MTGPRRPALAALLAIACAAGAALAQGSAHDQREAFMKSMAARVGPLVDMVQGKAPYDAGRASTLATELAALAGQDFTPLFPEGSDMVTTGEGAALPEIWQDMDGVMAAHQRLADATAALVPVAGNGLDALRGGIGAVGAACGDCHKRYRAPD